MGIFKEEIIFLEGLEKRQTRIYDDACDAGIDFADLSEKEINMLREALKTLKDLPGSKVVMDSHAGNLYQKQWDLIVMWGYANEGIYDATRVDILFMEEKTGKKRKKISIHICHAFTDKDGNVK